MIRCALSAIGLAALAVYATMLAYEGLHLPIVGPVIPGVIAGRLEGYVRLEEKIAAEARAAATLKQLNDARVVTEKAEKEIAAAKAAQVAAAITREKGIADYEQKLVEAKRACLLDDTDLQFFGVMHR